MAGLVAQAGAQLARLRFLITPSALLLPFAVEPAFAGAWIAPEEGQEIWTNSAGERGDMQAYESSVFIEAPLRPEASLVAAGWVEQGYAAGPELWRGEALLGLKHVVGRWSDTVSAVQGGAFWRSDPPADCDEGGAELRWLGGTSLGEAGRGFLNLEAAARLQSGGCLGRKLDLTAGYRPAENWLGLAQAFLDAPDEGEHSWKGQLSLVRFRRSGRGVQIGLRVRLDGAHREPSLIIGWWGDRKGEGATE